MERKNPRARGTVTTAAKRKKNVKTPPSPLVIRNEELYERVAQKAYELYQERGEEPGHDMEDWLTAEQLVKEALLHGPAPEEPLSVEEQER